MHPESLPLVVDFDRALLRSNPLLEYALSQLRDKPGSSLLLLSRLLVGRSADAYRQLADDPAHSALLLPVRDEVAQSIESALNQGRKVYLLSEHFELQAVRLAEQLKPRTGPEAGGAAGIEVIRLAPARYCESLETKSFDFLGAGAVESSIRQHANQLLPGPDSRHTAGSQSRTRLWLRELRLHQWLKNILLLVPLLASHRAGLNTLLAHELIAFVLFGLCASSVYLLNDLFDLQDDRRHPRKRQRPLASGELSLTAALWSAVGLALVSVICAWLLLPPRFTLVLATYYVLTLAYSANLKRIALVDVLCLAALYTLRIVAGTYAFGGALTFWMLAFSTFIFLSLALAKRYAELFDNQSNGRSSTTPGRDYMTSDLYMLASLGAASGYLSVMVLALYIQDENTVALYHHPKYIWLACPLLLYWISRTWMLTFRGQMHDDPVVFAVTDRASLCAGALFGAVFLFAA